MLQGLIWKGLCSSPFDALATEFVSPIQFVQDSLRLDKKNSNYWLLNMNEHLLCCPLSMTMLIRTNLKVYFGLSSEGSKNEQMFQIRIKITQHPKLLFLDSMALVEPPIMLTESQNNSELIIHLQAWNRWSTCQNATILRGTCLLLHVLLFSHMRMLFWHGQLYNLMNNWLIFWMNCACDQYIYELKFIQYTFSFDKSADSNVYIEGKKSMNLLFQTCENRYPISSSSASQIWKIQNSNWWTLEWEKIWTLNGTFLERKWQITDSIVMHTWMFLVIYNDSQRRTDSMCE